jgi:protein-glutamine gamma-glutamyltransferase
MNPPIQQPGGTAITFALDFYFEVALYFLVAIGFVTLASTGGLDSGSVAVMIGALAVRGYFLWKRHPISISDRWITPLTLAYFIFFAADYFVISHGFLPATVHLALFAVIVRMFSLRRERDYITLSILAFLMVLASAVLTVDSVFLLSFAAFMLMAVATFILLEMRHSLRAANLQARPSSSLQEQRTFAVTLARIAAALMIMIFVASAALFVILPRRSAGYLGGYSFGTDFSSGFSDHVRLGQIGRIQQSDAVVMHVQIEGDHTGRYNLHWRGVALGDFDGHTWSRPREQFALQRFDNNFSIPGMHNPTPRRSFVSNTIHYRVLMEPIGTNVFFLAPWAESVSGNYQLLVVDSGAAVYDFDTQHAITRYEADSDIGRPPAVELRTAGANYPAALAMAYLQLPTIDPRVSSLAEQVAGSAKTNFDKATAIENYLRTHYQYTLELPSVAPSDPIANFLFERKKGHCEYFASSMAVMLRTLGIPSRVVNGFTGGEFNDLTGNYVVRAKDAHAWVEMYFPGYGWQTFDPTPGGNLSTPQGWSRIALYLDAMTSFWREWIVSYDTSHQYAIGESVLNGTRSLWERAKIWTRMRYESLLDWARLAHHRAERSPVKWMLVALSLSIAFLLLRNLRWIARVWRETRLRAHPERAPEQAASIWYMRMARVLARRGVEKPAAMTAREFVQKIEDRRLREPLQRFTDVYESARFGNSAGDAERLPALYEEVELATRKS